MCNGAEEITDAMPVSNFFFLIFSPSYLTTFLQIDSKLPKRCILVFPDTVHGTENSSSKLEFSSLSLLRT